MNHISKKEIIIRTEYKKKAKVADFDYDGLFILSESLGLSECHEQKTRVEQGLPPKASNRGFQQRFFHS